MTLRDPFTGRFTTRRKYARALLRLAKARQRAFEEENDRELARLTTKARRYLPLEREPYEGARTWEFGTEYQSSRKWWHDVGVNVRLTFGMRVSESEARAALEVIMAGGDVDGVRVHSVSWARPDWGREKVGTIDNLRDFADLIATVGVANLRAGGVKLDEM